MTYLKNIAKKIPVLILGALVAGVIVFAQQAYRQSLLAKPLFNGVLAEAQGYGGGIRFIIRFDEQDKIKGIELLSHNESQDVLTYLQEKGFFNSWNGLTVSQAAAKKVDAISSATMTSGSVIEGLQKRLSAIAGVKEQKTKRKFYPVRFSLSLAVLIFALLSFFNPKAFSRLRIWLLLSSVFILGIINKDLLSLNQFFHWLMSGANGVSMLVLIFALSLVAALFMSRGFYCEYVCPYGALQEIVAHGKKRKFLISEKVRNILQGAGWIYFWIILAVLLFGLPLALEKFEPFAAFLFKSAPLASVGIACLFLAISVFIPRAWCTYFCPTGKIFNFLKGTSPKNTKRKYIKLLLIFLTLAAVVFLTMLRPKVILKTGNPPQTPGHVQDEKKPIYEEAMFYEKLKNFVVGCRLCPRHCVLKPGEVGFCRARKNINGKLYALTYGEPVALHADPIEKKPLAHVYPGTKSFSIATAGCNLRCKFCQNWEISQMDAEDVNVESVAPEEIVARAKASGCKTIAFTYTEPVIFYEYMLDIAKVAKQAGIDCVMHSAGYIEEEPLRKIAPYIKAANIDLKGFNEKFYTTFTQGDLQVVLRTLKILKEEGVWVEVTNLLIPGVNDSEEEVKNLCRWVKENLGAETPVHFSRFYPLYKLANLSPTPISSLMMAQRVAQEEGLQFIYLGNIPRQTGEQTLCPSCGKTLLRRIGYNLLENNIVDGKCRFCGYAVPGVWD